MNPQVGDTVSVDLTVTRVAGWGVELAGPEGFGYDEGFEISDTHYDLFEWKPGPLPEPRRRAPSLVRLLGEPAERRSLRYR